MLKVKSLNIGYNSSLLPYELNGSWKKGDIVVLLGDNGVGKSTLLKTLAGLHPPISGEVNLTTTKIGWVDSSIIKGIYLSVSDFLNFGIEACDVAIANWFTRFDLAVEQDRFIEELSDGQFRKLCIIRQILKVPKVLFLDEPTVYLDVKSKKQLVLIIKELQSECLIFCTTHDLMFAEEIKTIEISF